MASTVTTTTTTTTTTQAATSTTTLRSGVAQRRWVRPATLAAFSALFLLGAFLLILDMMTKEHQAQILGKETYLVTSTAASYLLDVSYLSVLAVATTACGASGLLGLP